jgi:hypothetical protein
MPRLTAQRIRFEASPNSLYFVRPVNFYFAGHVDLGTPAASQRCPDRLGFTPTTQPAKGTTMQYMILIYGDEKNFAQMASNPEAQKQMYAAFSQYNKDLRDAGILRGGGELRPTSSATTVRVKDGKILCSDGPFAETKEQLGGYYIIDVPDLDVAVKWAARCPAARGGSIEVRPLGVTPDTL